MNFTEMVEKAKTGRRLRREGASPDIVVIFTAWPPSPTPRNSRGFLATFHTQNGKVGVYNASERPGDLDATDWIDVT